MNIKQLKEKIAHLPDEMPVAINESANEATGLVRQVFVVNGEEDEGMPYDKGDSIYAIAASCRKRGRESDQAKIMPDTKVCFISS